MPKHLIVVCGPTCTGKSAIAIQLAKHFRTQIVSADSRQIYKHLDIGTAKPSHEDLLTVKHHLIGFLELDMTYNAGQFAQDARKIIDQIFQHSHYAVLCGGTGLYIKALTDGIDAIPPSSQYSKLKVRSLFQQGGLAAIQQTLAAVDPKSFARLDIKNPRRVCRALEVYYTTGIPLSALQSNRKNELPFKVHYFYLNLDRKILYNKIDNRVDKMIEMGLIEETKRCLDFKNNQALQTVGYKEIIAHLEGRLSLDVAIGQIKQHSRNYAKRQITWFKKYCPDNELDAASLDAALKTIIGRIDAKSY